MNCFLTGKSRLYVMEMFILNKDSLAGLAGLLTDCLGQMMFDHLYSNFIFPYS